VRYSKCRDPLAHLLLFARTQSGSFSQMRSIKVLDYCWTPPLHLVSCSSRSINNIHNGLSSRSLTTAERHPLNQTSRKVGYRGRQGPRVFQACAMASNVSLWTPLRLQSRQIPLFCACSKKVRTQVTTTRGNWRCLVDHIGGCRSG